MNDSTQTETAIIIDGKVNLDDYKIYWRDAIYKDLPNIVIFWGTMTVGALILALTLRNDFGFSLFLFPIIIAAIPILMTYYSYQQFMTVTKRYVGGLSEQEKHFNMVIEPGGKGIETFHGENYAFISWNSIGKAVEKDGYFALDYKTNPILIMKRDFKNQPDIEVFRNLIADKFETDTKLLH